METLVGCGVAEHDESCLCDVHIKEPVRLMSTRNFVKDMRYGPTIVEMFGFSAPWDKDSMLDYFEKLCFAHDSLSKEYIPNVLELDQMYMSERWKQIRDAVRDGLSHPSSPRIDVVLSRLGLSVEQFLEAATINQFHSSIPFSMDNLVTFGEIVSEPDFMVSKLCRQFGLSRGAVDGLAEYWSVIRDKKPSMKQKAKDIIIELSLQNKLPREIIPIVKEQTGLDYTKFSICQIKRRHAQRCQSVTHDDRLE